MDYVIARADYENLPEILLLQKICFQEAGEMYNAPDIPPLSQTLDEIQEDFKSKTFLKFVIHGMIVGSVNAYEVEKSCRIGRLVVHPEYRKRGIGSKLMDEIEKVFSDSNRYVLFTGYKQLNNIRLYEKLGYHIYKRENGGFDIELVFMEKKINQ